MSEVESFDVCDFCCRKFKYDPHEDNVLWCFWCNALYCHNCDESHEFECVKSSQYQDEDYEE